ncbi:ABC transporter ATP-binding protein [Eremococcus coleocola]|uniref:ABC transporter ATP-binding protein n=1 Tax=Eremococcus coleocola TaxID=88132 RepID=UPI000421C85C|nr:ABC transporter ATP-binding protein [Eremococcus coleocola]
MNSIEIKHLSFSYGKKIVLNNINLSIGNGLYGLLGKNGAGKTTLMKLIVGLLPKSKGQIKVCGETDPKKIRSVVGYLPQDFDFYPDMKVREALIYLGTLDNMKGSQLNQRVDELLGLVNLSQNQNKKIKDLSGGMKRRLGIAQSLLNNPHVLIVDEPTAGLDPEERIRFRNLLSDLSAEKIVLFSTHIASDLESTANRLGILDNGHFIYDGSVEYLLKEYSGGTYETIVNRKDYTSFKSQYIVFEQKELAEGILVRFIHYGRPLAQFKRISPSLESAYLMKIYDRRR